MSTSTAPDLAPVLASLRAHLPQLYAIVDPAREPEVLPWLRGSGLAHQCLLQGEKAVALAEEAPHLVHFGEEVAVLKSLVKRWHDSAAVTYLVSGAPFHTVRRHLRRIQRVKSEDGEILYFRFFDPRIARVFLPTCDQEQIEWMFGDCVERWMMEDEDSAQLLDIHPASDGARVQVGRAT